VTSRDRSVLAGYVDFIEGPNRGRCIRLWKENEEIFEAAQGSSASHQVWKGGYLDHVTDTMTLARRLSTLPMLPFALADVMLALFLHDVEKPWKDDYRRNDPEKLAVFFTRKRDRLTFKLAKIEEYGIELTTAQWNAIVYAEGEGDDYRAGERVMGELAAFVHSCDVLSARLYHSVYLTERA
jgi:hypothetical protein